MTPRVLIAAAVTLVVLLVLEGLVAGIAPAAGNVMTRVGLIPAWDLAATVVATFIGGLVARRGFRWIAVALIALVWLAGIVAAWMMAPADLPGASDWLIRNNAVGLVLNVAAAWIAAFAGERLAQWFAAGPASG